MKTILQQVVTSGYPQLRATKTLPPHCHRAAWALMSCRSAALGGHVQGCPDGHVQQVWYNSCRHRSCPLCNQLQIERWLQRQRSRLIEHPHRHLIFTMPHELLPYWRLNTDLMTRLLFKAVQETLFSFVQDARYLGATPGLLSVLHTWGRSLNLHPHLHCVITEGGLDARGQWREPVKRCFLPIRAVMAKYRGKYLDWLRRAEAEGRLRRPHGESSERCRSLFNRLGRQPWNVHIRERYRTAQGVVDYLARYVRGGPLRNNQLSTYRPEQDDVVFRYYAHRDNPEGDKQRARRERLSSVALTERLLQHVPSRGLHVVRAYGLYATGCREALDQARARLGQAAVEPPEPLDWRQYLQRFQKPVSPTHCPQCQRPLGILSTFKPTRGPP
jgi:hypothetical protein